MCSLFEEVCGKENAVSIAVLAVCRFKAWDSNKHGLPSIADQCAFLNAEVSEIEDVPPTGGGPINEEP